MKRTFYEKVGRRYVPVYEYDSDMYAALPEGTHLVMCRPGGQSTRYSVDPAFAPMIAAGRYAQEAITHGLIKASEMRPSRQPVTEEQRAAWDQLKQAFGEEMYALHIPSLNDIADAGVAAMQQEADKLLKHPAVKAAYDDFMLLCKLTMEAKDTE